MHWEITSWPPCSFDVFLSHCAEDRADLVLPLKRRLEKLQIRTWVDRHNYPYGPPPAEALRQSLMSCRHVVYLITDDYLKQARGWTCWESAYGVFIDGQLTHMGDSLLNYQLPLFFLEKTRTDALARSVWGSLQYIGPVFSQVKASRVDWAAKRILTHIEQAQRLVKDCRQLLKSDSRLQTHARQVPGFLDRVLYR